MPDSPVKSPQSQPVLARESLERVLARASELQASGAETDGGALTEEQLVELAGEVGLSRDHVRQALAEERARIDLDPDSGVPFALLGTATIQAARTIPGDAATVLAALDSWMQSSESLQVKRRFPGQLAWEPRHDFLSTVRRAIRLGGRGFHLAAVTEVRAVVATVEGKRSHARIVASYAGVRAQRTSLALGAATVGVLIGLPLFWLASNAGLGVAAALSLVPALGVPALAITMVRRRYRSLVERGQIALEQALDRLEYGDSLPRGN